MASKDKKQPGAQDESSWAEIKQRLKTRPFLYIGTVLVFIIITIAFVFVPAISPEGGMMEDLTFGYFNRVPIRYASGNIFHQVQQSLYRENQHLISDDPNSIWLVYQIWRRAFEEAALFTGIQNEMKLAGFITPEHVVDREVARHFHDEDGRFMAARYRAMDNNERMRLWRQVQEGMAVNRYMSDLFDLRTSSNEVSFIGSMASPRRSFNLAVFPLSSYPDSEVVTFAQAYPDLFRITRLSRITLNGEREARQILDMVRNETITFEEAARTLSQDRFAEWGGDMGMRMAFELAREIRNEQERNSVMNLARGELSDIVSLPTGWAFFRAEEASSPADTNDPLQMERIRNYIIQDVRGIAEDWLFAQAESFSSRLQGRNFNDVAAEGNIMRRSFGPVSVNFGDLTLFSSIRTAEVPEVQDAGRNIFFWEAAFSTPLMTASVPFIHGDNVMVLFPTEENDAEEFDVRFIELYYPNRVMEYMNTMNRNYFLGNERLDDRFDETFWRLWNPN